MVDEAMRLRVIRAITGWNQLAMCERMQVSPGTVRNWERGFSVPNTKSRKALGEVCKEFKIGLRPDGFPVPVSE